jgi:monovalent cation/hydrogen antiporter
MCAHTVLGEGDVLVGLELVVALGVAVLLASVLAGRLRIAAPVLLLVFGVLLGFAPTLRGVHLPAEVMLLLFLPALLYWESLTTSLREIRNNLRVVLLLSTLLVIATAAAVAWVAHALGLAWGPAWILGAAVAPTDATAVGVLARALPRRSVTVLRAESLVNDGTALVIYGLALGVTIGEEQLSGSTIAWHFLLSYVGGAAAGLLTGWLCILVRRRLHDPVHGTVVSVLTPFVAFLLAELVHASGVLAVVVCGLWLSQVGPRVVRADTRQLTRGFWSMTTFVLNGALFVLVGLEAHGAVRQLPSVDLSRGAIAVAVVSVTVVAVRFTWMFTTPYVMRVLDRRPVQRLRRIGARARVVSAVAGFRGAVSLAAALAVPQTLESGERFADRDLIVFVTAGVIVTTLVVQAVVLPGVVRWARLPPDTAMDEERHFAEVTAAEEALDALPRLAEELRVDGPVLDRLVHEYGKHLRVLRANDGDVEDSPALRFDEHDTVLRLAAVAHKRATVVRLRDERRIDDIVLRQLQTRLDIEEVRLLRADVLD